jgi:hypothetical protein
VGKLLFGHGFPWKPSVKDGLQFYETRSIKARRERKASAAELSQCRSKMRI